MSQSDYIKYKRVATQLKIDKLAPVLSNEQYTDFKQYSIENTITNTDTLLNELLTPNTNIIFNMQKNISSCPTFPVCINTNTRSYRIPMGKIYFTPRPVPTYVKQPSYAKTACNCIPNSKHTNNNIACCKLSH
jgi:hypothetical protein